MAEAPESRPREGVGPRSLAAGMAVTPNVRLVRPLGAGGMGAVWLADHAGLKTRVVVKFMLGGGEATPSARARFAREAAAAAQVKSPHVVQMLDHGVTEDGIPFIVMEHLEGRDLGAVLDEHGALDPVTAVAIVSQIGKALGKVHAAGLLHRDIKPDNIFVCDNEDEVYVKLLDFGVVKRDAASEAGEEGALDGSTNTGQVVGTPFYMSPEQVTAQKALDARSDLWSLGVVAYEALTGKRPFDGPSFGALAVLIATGVPAAPSSVNPDLPKEVDAWFAKACARDPAARFATARELSDALRAAFGALVPPMSDSGQRSLASSRPRRKAQSDDTNPTSATPSFVNASTLESTPEAKREATAPGLGATGAAVVETRTSQTDGRVSSPARTRTHVVLGGVFALAGAAAVVLLSMSREPRVGAAGSVPSKTASAERERPVERRAPPPPEPSAEPVATSPAAIDAGGATHVTPPTQGRPPASPHPRVVDAGAPSRTPAPSSAPSASARPPLHPPPGHDDPLF